MANHWWKCSVRDIVLESGCDDIENRDYLMNKGYLVGRDLLRGIKKDLVNFKNQLFE